MITKDLIKMLQKLVDEHESHKEIFGEHEMMIDIFTKCDGKFEYAGISPHIVIEQSGDGVYNILSAFARSRK